MSVQPGQAGYTCPYCRIPSDGSSRTCPHCGAPVDVKRRVSDSGWVEQPPIRDMARIRFSRSTCQITGKYVPVAEMELHADDWVYFSHHVLLHTDPQVRLEAMPMAGGWNRMRAGMPLVMMTAHGPGHIAFSADHPGETIAVPLPPGGGIHVLEHRFLTATGNVGYTWQPAPVWFMTGSGNDTEYHYPIGRALDVFTARDSPGLLLLHAAGNTFIRDLGEGESILIQPSALIWKDLSVRMWLLFEYPAGTYTRATGVWQAKTTWLTLHGPGRVAMQSVFRRPEPAGIVHKNSGATFKHWNQDPRFKQSPA